MDRFDYTQIPQVAMAGLTAYIEHRRPTGSFLRAVLENNLSKACENADDINLPILPVYVAYLYNEAPAACHGNREMVDAWITGVDL